MRALLAQVDMLCQKMVFMFIGTWACGMPAVSTWTDKRCCAAVRQRAVSDAYGIIVNVVTSDQHNWCAASLQQKLCSSLLINVKALRPSVDLFARQTGICLKALRQDIRAVHGRSQQGSLLGNML